MRRMIVAAVLALVAAVATGCGGTQDQDGPRLANPDQADPRLKAVGSAPAAKAGGVASQVRGKVQ